MPSKKISALPAYTSPIPTDLLVIVDVTTNVTKKIQLANVNKGLNPLVYKAYLTQTGGAAPVATVVYNTIGAIVWTRNAQGIYYGTLTGAFPAGKVWVISGLNISNATIASSFIYAILFSRLNNNVVEIDTYLSAVASDGILDNTQISIEVYP